MNRSIKSLSLATVLVASFTPVQAFDSVTQWYRKLMLGNVLYQVLQDKIEENQCDVLKKKPARQEIVDYVLIANDYAVPFWVSMFNRVSPYESLLSYAQNVYRVVLNVFTDIEGSLEANFPDIKRESNQLKDFMGFVVDPADPGAYSDSDEFEKQIAKNIEDAKNILNGYQMSIKNSQVDEAKKVLVLNSIDRGLDRINNAARRLTWLERKYREMQMKRFEDYISRYCK